MQYVQFKYSDKKEIISVFTSPQEDESYPNLGEVEDDDFLYLDFINLFN